MESPTRQIDETIGIRARNKQPGKAFRQFLPAASDCSHMLSESTCIPRIVHCFCCEAPLLAAYQVPEGMNTTFTNQAIRRLALAHWWQFHDSREWLTPAGVSHIPESLNAPQFPLGLINVIITNIPNCFTFPQEVILLLSLVLFI